MQFFRTTSEFLGQIARARGKLQKGGSLDYVAAAQLVLAEWASGKVQHYCIPPPLDAELEESGEIVSVSSCHEAVCVFLLGARVCVLVMSTFCRAIEVFTFFIRAERDTQWDSLMATCFLLFKL